MTPSRIVSLSDSDAPLRSVVAVLNMRAAKRRRVLQGALGAAMLAASGSARALACSVVPSETRGPFPGDGTNGANALTQSGIVRSDIRASFGTAGDAVAPGTLLTLTIRLVDAGNGCAPLAGHAVYVWHCDASGRYSMYSRGVTEQNYLRGVQVSDALGQVAFTTIYPGAYPGRWPHVHFEVYASAGQAVSGHRAIKTSQLALPEASSREVYAQARLYPSSLAYLDQTPLRADGVFADDMAVLQMASVTGAVSSGYAATLQVGIAAR